MTVLKPFQQEAVARAADSISARLSQGRRVAHSLEAPTGIGKTLMSGHIAAQVTEQLTHERILWFWFAPFSGLVHQARSTIRDEFPALRVRDIETERHELGCRSGDVFVLTWALLSNRSSEVNTGSEHGPSLAVFCDQLREQGWRIGIVVDESHHSVKIQGVAMKVVSQVLRPDVMLLVSATPNDAALQKLVDAGHLAQHLSRQTVSRREGVEAGLLKPRMISTTIISDERSRVVDTGRTALALALKKQRELQVVLDSLGISMTPLLLLQVDSKSDSVDQARRTCLEMGVSESQIAVHTADEPDEHLLATALDDNVHVLIFKVAAATGFDAPRAFVLCSMRPVKDQNFGLQIVGRISRVDRRLQPLAISGQLPVELQSGYVFLGTPDRQVGLDQAAQLVSSMKSVYSAEFDEHHIVRVSERRGASPSSVNSGMPTLFDQGILEVQSHVVQDVCGSSSSQDRELVSTSVSEHVFPLTVPSRHTYALRRDLGLPEAFLTVVSSPASVRGLEEAAARRLNITADLLLVLSRESESVLVEERDLYVSSSGRHLRVDGYLSATQMQQQAVRILSESARSSGLIDPAKLELSLRSQLQWARTQAHMPALDPADLAAQTRALIYRAAPELREAVAYATQVRRQVELAAPLPDVLESDRALEPSQKSIYGVYPMLDSWEKRLAQEFDIADEVLWWHRNEPRKPWSVRIPLPGGRWYYPDFIVCVRGRLGSGIVLVEPKERILDPNDLALRKVHAEHPEYGKPMMLYLERGAWRVVEEDSGLNVLGRNFHPRLLVHWR